MASDPIQWLLASAEPWTRYRTMVDLLDLPEDDPQVLVSRAEMLAHPQVKALMAKVSAWPGRALKRHNDASHPIHTLSILADFGLRADDPEVVAAIEAVMTHQAPEGAFQSVLNVAQAYGGTGEDEWAWMLCDAPVLLYVLLAMGLGEDIRVRRAVDHLVGLVEDNGWRCVVAPELGKFRGPGRRSDPCPVANLYALKALARVPELLEGPAVHASCEMLLGHWEHQRERKIYMFGIGTDFRKLKYPFVWYDVLHVVDTLRLFPSLRADPRFREMVDTIASQAGADGRYTVGSMYRAWEGWSFAEKKQPSPWLTLLVLRVLRNVRPR